MFIAMLVADGLNNKDIAPLVGNTEYVVKNKIVRIYDKLGFHNRTELAMWFVKQKHDKPKAKAQGGSA